MAITSIEEFKNKAHSIIDLPGFGPGEKVTVKVRKVSILGLASSGKIPNSLMGTVTKLFNANTKEQQVSATNNVIEMTQLMNLIAKNSLVEPEYEEVKEYLTDEQLNGIFEYAMGGVKDITPIDGK